MESYWNVNVELVVQCIFLEKQKIVGRNSLGVGGRVRIVV